MGLARDVIRRFGLRRGAGSDVWDWREGGLAG